MTRPTDDHDPDREAAALAALGLTTLPARDDLTDQSDFADPLSVLGFKITTTEETQQP